MVLAGIWEKRNRRRHIAQGRAIGREEGEDIGWDAADNAWRDWMHRRDAAAAAGVPFDEPMPEKNRHRNGSSSGSA